MGSNITLSRAVLEQFEHSAREGENLRGFLSSYMSDRWSVLRKLKRVDMYFQDIDPVIIVIEFNLGRRKIQRSNQWEKFGGYIGGMQ